MFTCQGYNNQGCGSTRFTLIEGTRESINGVLHRQAVCERGHRNAFPVLGPVNTCPSCHHQWQEPVRAPQNMHAPGGLAPTEVRAQRGRTSAETLDNVAKALGLGGSC